MIYHYEPEKSPEYIRRESARTVAKLPPFRLDDKNALMNETLPEGGGQWTMVFRPGCECTFVWMGYDDPANPNATSREMKPLLSRASMNLALEIVGRLRELQRLEMLQVEQLRTEQK